MPQTRSSKISTCLCAYGDKSESMDGRMAQLMKITDEETVGDIYKGFNKTVKGRFEGWFVGAPLRRTVLKLLRDDDDILIQVDDGFLLDDLNALYGHQLFVLYFMVVIDTPEEKKQDEVVDVDADDVDADGEIEVMEEGEIESEGERNQEAGKEEVSNDDSKHLSEGQMRMIERMEKFQQQQTTTPASGRTYSSDLSTVNDNPKNDKFNPSRGPRFLAVEHNLLETAERMKRKDQGETECAQCHKKFKGKKGLKIHVTSVHVENKNK